ncbi:MAG: DNA mismatch endonuclease Vsr [Candidatus Eisenbacteria bacterium]|nr:DNA mismatch endonuclease Vsr [Candidatus Eisenbacteria bacterium]
MPDVFTKEKRSQVMSRIRGRGNRETEIALVRLFRVNRINGWRRHVAILGRPDFVFRRERVIVFVDGCFWHQCPTCSNMPVNNREFWEDKLHKNVVRDRVVSHSLRSDGWKVVRIWEHELRRPAAPLKRIMRALGRDSAVEPYPLNPD